MIYWMAIGLVAVALLLLGVLIGEVMKPKEGKLKHVRTSHSRPNSAQKLRPVQGQASIPYAQESELIRLMNGDRNGAYRLVDALRLRHPDKSEKWLWEKAIFDLERDRV